MPAKGRGLMRKMTVGMISVLALLCNWSQAEAKDGSSSKFMGQYGKEARQAVEEDAARHGDQVQGMIDEHVDRAMEELSHVIRRLVAEAVHASIAEAMAQRDEGEPPEDIVIVDTEGNVLELLAIEDGTLVVDYKGDDEYDEDDPRLKKINKRAGRQGFDESSSK